MAIIFTCTKCEKTLQMREEMAGHRARCPECGAVLQIPEPVLDAEEVLPSVLPAETAAIKESAEKRRPCPMCGEMILAAARKCRYCGEIFDETIRKDIGDDAGIRLLLPVGRSGWAIAAGYLGLISVLVFPAPFALLAGILAIRDMRRDPSKHGMGRAVFGIVMGAIGTAFLLLGLISFIVAVSQRR
jgi:predicted RNA-binding Zn-ribbon protein involved in translation (DUF1610 family)